MSMLSPVHISTFLPESFRFVSYTSPKLKQSITFATLGRTKQQFRDECDVNLVMARYLKTGILDGSDPSTARYMDVSSSMDFHQAMTFIAEAQGQFYDLPANIRYRFKNDPGELLAFLENPFNKAEAVALGLVRDPNVPRETVPLGTPNPDLASSASQPVTPSTN